MSSDLHGDSPPPIQRSLLARLTAVLNQLSACEHALHTWSGPGHDALKLAQLISLPLPAALTQALHAWPEHCAAARAISLAEQDHLAEQLRREAELAALEQATAEVRGQSEARLLALRQLVPLARNALRATAEVQAAGERISAQRGGLSGLWKAVSGQVAALQRDFEQAGRREFAALKTYTDAAGARGHATLPPGAVEDHHEQESAAYTSEFRRLQARRAQVVEALDVSVRAAEQARKSLEDLEQQWQSRWRELPERHGVPVDPEVWAKLWARRATGQDLYRRHQALQDQLRVLEVQMEAEVKAETTRILLLETVPSTVSAPVAVPVIVPVPVPPTPHPSQPAPLPETLPVIPQRMRPRTVYANLYRPTPVLPPPQPDRPSRLAASQVPTASLGGAAPLPPLPGEASLRPPATARSAPRPDRTGSIQRTPSILSGPATVDPHNAPVHAPTASRPTSVTHSSAAVTPGPLSLPGAVPAVVSPLPGLPGGASMRAPATLPPSPPPDRPGSVQRTPSIPPGPATLVLLTPPAPTAPPPAPITHSSAAVTPGSFPPPGAMPGVVSPLPGLPAVPMPMPTMRPAPFPAAVPSILPATAPPPRRIRLPGTALPGQPPPPAGRPQPAPGRLTQRERAEREAVRISDQYNWARGFVLLADNLDRERWGQLLSKIEQKIAEGMTPEEFELALQLRGYWHGQSHFQSPRTARYDSLPWDLALALIRRCAGVPCIEEMIFLIERIYDCERLDHSGRFSPLRHLSAFSPRLWAILEQADPDLDLEYWLSVQEARCLSR